jgi:hypothetical protein
MNCSTQTITIKRNTYAAWALLMVGLLSFGQTQAAPVEVLNYDLTPAGDGYTAAGNIFSFSQDTVLDPVTTYTIQISGWSQTGADVGNGEIYETATLVDVGAEANLDTLGLGVCNTAEPANCKTKKNQRGMDSENEVDWILVLLPEFMTINSFEVTPEEDKNRSLTYYTGRIDAADLSGLTPSTLPSLINGRGWDVFTDEDLGKPGKKDKDKSVGVTVTASGYRNALLIGARTTGAGKKAQSANITLTNVNVSTVPIPAAVWMLGSALSALFLGRRFNKKAATQA